MAGGFIKIWRAIRDHWVWRDPARLRAWLDLLLLAAYQDGHVVRGGRIVPVKRGQVFASQVALARMWGLDRKTVRAFLELLRADEMVDFTTDTSGATGYTLITIRNYEEWQGMGNSGLDTPLPTRSPLDFPTAPQNMDTALPTQADTPTPRPTDSIPEGRTLDRTLDRTLAPHSLPSALPTSKKLKNGRREALLPALDAPGGPAKPSARANSGHPAVTGYCDAWAGRYGTSPDISGKDAQALARLWRKQGAEEYVCRLGRYLGDADPFLVKVAHSAGQFESRWNALGVAAGGGHANTRANLNARWKDRPGGEVAL